MLRVVLGSEGCDPWVIYAGSVGEFLATYFDSAGHRAVDSAAVEQMRAGGIRLESVSQLDNIWQVTYDLARVDHMVGEWCGHEFADWQVVRVDVADCFDGAVGELGDLA
jgi:hypothetical protein